MEEREENVSPNSQIQGTQLTLIFMFNLQITVETTHQPEKSEDNSDDEDWKLDEKEKLLWTKINKILDTYFVNEFQRLALNKFIKVKVCHSFPSFQNQCICIYSLFQKLRMTVKVIYIFVLSNS